MNIHDDLGALKQRLKDLADVINAFKSEAVQLKVLELLVAGVVAAPVEKPPIDKPPRTRRKAAKATKNKATSPSEPKGKSARTSTGRGAFAIVSSLVTEGFFKTPRTIRHVIDHSGIHKGRHLKPNEISPALLRLLRNETLARKKNKDNQYEYVQK